MKVGDAIDPIKYGFALIDASKIMTDLGYELIKGPVTFEELPEPVKAKLAEEKAKIALMTDDGKSEKYDCPLCGMKNWGRFLDAPDGDKVRVCGACYKVAEVK